MAQPNTKVAPSGTPANSTKETHYYMAYVIRFFTLRRQLEPGTNAYSLIQRHRAVGPPSHDRNNMLRFAMPEKLSTDRREGS